MNAVGFGSLAYRAMLVRRVCSAQKKAFVSGAAPRVADRYRG